MEVQVGIRIAEGAQVDLVAAPQFLHCTGGPGQIPGEGGQLLRPALAQLLPVVLQRQGAAALVGLILEEIEHTGLHLADLVHDGLPALVMFIAVKASHG